jgi:hypothetical protein
MSETAINARVDKLLREQAVAAVREGMRTDERGRGIYRENWFIDYEPKPGPPNARGVFPFDYNFWHNDYDGGDVDYETPSRDPRCGCGSSIEDCMDQIDEIELDLAEEKR